MIRMVVLLLGLLAFFTACTPAPERAYYYWKNAQLPQSAEIAILDSLDVPCLYVRLFDLDEKGQIQGSLKISSRELANLRPAGKVIPVVYIQQAVFLAKPETQSLAKLVATAVLARWQAGAGAEIQIDCDWTATSREAYFGFLTSLRGLLPSTTSLSVTIRLHQLKDRAANGIPPADRGMLMAYNLLNPASPVARSAILDLATLKNYAPYVKDYPLDLDLALPTWTWVAQFEGRRFIGLIADPGAPAAIEGGEFDRQSDGSYLARSSGILAGRSIEAGDRLIIDQSTLAKTREALAILKPYLSNAQRRIALFHLDADTVMNFAAGDLESVAKIWTLAP